MKPGLQKLILGGKFCGEDQGRTYVSKQNVLCILNMYDFMPGRYRVAGRMLRIERVSQTNTSSGFEVWLEQERGDNTFERVATFIRKIAE